MPRKHLLIIISIYLPICLIYYLRTTQITYPGFPLDDSWIHQVFARNIATGHGFSFNPDQPVAGATAPLWTLLLALAWMIGGPIAGGIITGIICQFLAYVAIYKIAQIITRNRNLALLTAILSVLFWQTIWGAMSGMEPGLYSALSLWGLYFYFKADRLSHKYSYLSYLLFTLAFLARPECALFIVFALIRDFYEWMKSERRRIDPWIYRFLLFAILTAPYFIFNYWSTETLLPNTFSAKIGGRDIISSLLNGDLKKIFLTLTLNPFLYFQHFYLKAFPANPLLVVATLAGLIKLMGSDSNMRSKNIMLSFLFLLYVPLIGVFVPVFTATYQHFRYISNLLPIMVFLGVLGLSREQIADVKRHSAKITVVAVFLIVVGLGLKYIFLYLSDLIIPIITEMNLYPGINREGQLLEIVTKFGRGTALTGIIILTGYLLNTDKVSAVLRKRIFHRLVMAVTIASGAFITIRNADTLANNVRNINEADINAARFLEGIAEEGDVAAVNDIGSFGYYSNIEIFDLWGLTTRELSFDRIRNDSLVFQYMYDKKRVDFLAVFPNRFPYLTGRTDIFTKIGVFVSENNTILGEDSTVIYKAEWPDSVTDNYQERE